MPVVVAVSEREEGVQLKVAKVAAASAMVLLALQENSLALIETSGGKVHPFERCWEWRKD